MGMRIPSGTLPAQSASQGVAAWQQRKQQFQALSQALQSGNLDAAKAAYSALTSNGAKTAASNPNSPLAQVGKALQSGDLGAAQQAFAALKSHSHHRGGGSGSGGVQSQPAPAPIPTTSGGLVNLVA